MATVEVSRTLVKSPPELWTELNGERLADAVGGATVAVAEEGRRIEWEADGAHGQAVLEPAGWGTKLTLRAEIDEVTRLEPEVARGGLWARLLGAAPAPPPPARPSGREESMRRTLEQLLDELAPPAAGRSRTAEGAPDPGHSPALGEPTPGASPTDAAGRPALRP